MEQLNASKYRYDLDGLRRRGKNNLTVGGKRRRRRRLYRRTRGRAPQRQWQYRGAHRGHSGIYLSGYFFLGAQLRYATREGANLNPWWPFWRTLRRLVPVLVVVLGATVLTGARCSGETLLLAAPYDAPWDANIQFW